LILFVLLVSCDRLSSQINDDDDDNDEVLDTASSTPGGALPG